MRIIIEGADGSGKSTLAKALQEHYGDIDIVHMRGIDTMRFPFLYHSLSKQRVIYDRHFISERIYSKFYNLPKRITKGQSNVLLQQCIDNDIAVLVCLPTHHKLMDDEDTDIIERHQELVDGYRDACDTMGLKPIDPFDMTVEEVVAVIETGSWK